MQQRTCCIQYYNRCSKWHLFAWIQAGRWISIHQLPQRQLSAVRQTRPHSDAAAVVLWNVSKLKVVFLHPFVANSFTNLLAPKPLNPCWFLKMKCDSLYIDPFRWFATSAEECNENEVTLVPCFIKTHQLFAWRLKTLCRFTVPKTITTD